MSGVFFPFIPVPLLPSVHQVASRNPVDALFLLFSSSKNRHRNHSHTDTPEDIQYNAYIDLDKDRTNSWMDGTTVRLMVRQTDKWIDGETGGQTDRQAGQMNGQTDLTLHQMDRQLD